MNGVVYQRGLRFQPTDSELMDYLLDFVAGYAVPPQELIVIANLYGEKEPWDIFNEAAAAGTAGGDSSQQTVKYFITPLKKENSSKNCSRFARTVGKNYMATWKAVDKPKPVKNDRTGQIVGLKRSLRYERKKSSSNETLKNQWRMKEFSLKETATQHKKVSHKDYVLCIIKKKHSVSDDDVVDEAESLIATMQEEKDKFHPPIVTGESSTTVDNSMAEGDGSNFVNCSMVEGNQDWQIQNDCLYQYDLPPSSSSETWAAEGTHNILCFNSSECFTIDELLGFDRQAGMG